MSTLKKNVNKMESALADFMATRPMSHIMLFSDIAGDVERILDLVQENEEFFGNLVAGDSKMKAAADKLEELVRGWQREQI